MRSSKKFDFSCTRTQSFYETIDFVRFMGSCTDFSYYDVTIEAAVEFSVGTFKAYKAVFFTMIDPMTRSTSPDYPKKLQKNRESLLTF